jgi:hypothetical protein
MRFAPALLLAPLIVACGSVSNSASSSVSSSTTAKPVSFSRCTGAAAPAGYDHVVWIMMENHHRDAVLGSPSAPFETGLAAGCASAANYAHVGRPSLPNYLGATSGSTFGVRDDASPARHPITADNLFRQVRRAGGAARTYAEAMPGPCALTPAGRYGVKHNPAAYYQGADDRAACRRDDLPLGTLAKGPLAADLANDTLARFTLVIPDLCNDTHDCPVALGDRWLQQWVTAITSSSSFSQGRTAVFVVWDEPTPMPFLAIAPSVRPGTVVANRVDHYALLRTTEEMLGLPLLGAARTTPSMRGSLHV